jgi:pimeloyl-ACP methyl ester carboxylesterase
VVQQVLEDAVAPVTRMVELPGRGVTRVWECAGPHGAETLMLIHGVACTAELNWGKVLAPLGCHFRVVAADLRGHGDGISAGLPFRLEDCADDIAALAQALDIRRFVAVGYSMGGIIAQLLYRRHRTLVSGLVLCATSGNVLGSPAEKLAALALPAAAAAIWWNPVLRLASAEIVGMALLGPVDDPATAEWVRAQLRRTPLATAVSAIQAVCEFTSDDWIGQVDVPTAVVVTSRDCIAPVGRQLKLARAVPGASVYEVDADHAVCITAPGVFARALLQACRAVQQDPRPGGRAQAAPVLQALPVDRGAFGIVADPMARGRIVRRVGVVESDALRAAT